MLKYFLVVLSLTFSNAALCQTDTTNSKEQSVQDVSNKITENEKKLRQELEQTKSQLKESRQELKNKISNVENEAKAKADSLIRDQLNRFKHIILEFGILPNSDKKINNFSKLNLNYSPSWHSHVTYYTNTSSSTKKYKTPADGEPEDEDFEPESDINETATTERTDIKINILEYSLRPIDKGPKVFELFFGLGVDYYEEENQYRYTEKQAYEGDSYAGNGEESDEYTQMAPHLDIRADWKNGRGFVAGVSASVLFAVSNENEWNDKGSGYTETPVENQEGQVTKSHELYDLKSKTEYTGNGYKVGANMEWVSKTWGSVGVHFERSESKGDTEGAEREFENGESIVTKIEFEETRARQQFAFTYGLEFLAKYGVVPILKIAQNQRTIERNPDPDPDLDRNINQREYGLLFRY